jgi:amino-acid N-acetyltransferase
MTPPPTVALGAYALEDRHSPPGADAIALRTATVDEVEGIHGLIEESIAEGHLLPRKREEIASRIHRFVVAIQAGDVVACAELAPLSRSVAEIRSLVVRRPLRGLGVGRRIVEELLERARAARFDELCAFAHSPAYFVRMGFSIVPHVWLPEKILTDCQSCCHFRRCGQQAVVRTLARSRAAYIPLTAVHG